MNNNILILRSSEVTSILNRTRHQIIDTVSNAYQLHAQGKSSLPHSTFLRFAGLPSNRIIALPAYLGANVQTAGVKWIASAPANIHKGMERASAVIVLNNPETGMPWAVLEGSAISAARTAASAALAAGTIRSGLQTDAVGLIGCGRINFEVIKYLREILPGVSTFMVFDLDEDRKQQFKFQIEQTIPDAYVISQDSIGQALAECPLISLATTASTPHISDFSMCPRGATILNLSLRDLAPGLILGHDNVVDDLDHVCRAQTSVHLAEQLFGGRDFVRCSLGEILLGNASPRQSDDQIVIFSPFGLGILDIAVAKLVCEIAIAKGMGFNVESFLPTTTWNTNFEKKFEAVV